MGELARSAITTMTVVLLTFWSVGQLGTWWNPPVDALVLAVMLAIGLPRALMTIPRRDWPGAAPAMFVGVTVATGCAMLLTGDVPQFIAGASAFSVAAALPIWLRRFGPRWRAAGTAAGLPFVAILVQPLPMERTCTTLGWMLVAAGTALGWALAIAHLVPAHSYAAAHLPAPDRTPPTAGTATGRRLASSTRQAIQLLIALAVTFVLARLIDPDHLVWPVLTVLLVSSGNHGRVDVAVKGGQRMIGALAGTAIATLLAAGLAPGDNRGLVAVFAILAISAALRPLGYVYWTAGITAALAFLYGYFGQGGSDLLGHRLLGVAVGSVAAILAAWFILPIRARDVLLRRLADALAAATTVLTALREGQDRPEITALTRAEDDLRRLLPITRATRQFRRGTAQQELDELSHALELTSQVKRHAAIPPSAREPAAITATGREVITARQQLAARHRISSPRPTRARARVPPW